MEIQSYIGKKTGNTLFRPLMTESELRDASEESQGFCVRCGEIADGVEPDATRYKCEGCGEYGVYGFEQLLIMGGLRIVESEETADAE